MNILSIIESQKEKTNSITIDSSLSEYKVSARKHLELQIKLSILAEETKCYRYWVDNATTIDSEILLSKYVDFLGHIISFGIDKNYISSYDIIVKPTENCLSDQFINLYIDINDLMISPSEDHFLTLLEDTLILGISLEFSEEQILNAYN